MFARKLTLPNGTRVWRETICVRGSRRAPVVMTGVTEPSSKARRQVAARPRRAGMTLTELLVVVAVMVILIGMAVPMMRNGLEERKLREASRQLNTAFALAKGIAAETGRAAGIWIDTQTLPGAGSVAGQVFLAETPPPYAGDIVGATARVNLATSPPQAKFKAVQTMSLQKLVQPNDLIKFNYRGPLYRITGVTSAVQVTLDTSGLPQPPAGIDVPYQIFRQPVKSSSMPLELPAGAVVDVGNSGFGLSDSTFTTAAAVTKPIVVMFQPDGSVERLWIIGGGAPVFPTETIHFLLGKVEQVGTTSGNLQDNTCLWVSVSPQTGRVTTAENGYDSTSTTALATARQFAQSGQMMGGR